mmetsp:Transcript_108438/g.317231  ORF Transcript_108438/g.317231 Transcript_108438/m.317231 type:complete len:206 (-) Transcript_108438:78-695(-)
MLASPHAHCGKPAHITGPPLMSGALSPPMSSGRPSLVNSKMTNKTLRIVIASSFHIVFRLSTHVSSFSPLSAGVLKSLSHKVRTAAVSATLQIKLSPEPNSSSLLILSSCLAAGTPVASSTRSRMLSKVSSPSHVTGNLSAPTTTNILPPAALPSAVAAAVALIAGARGRACHRSWVCGAATKVLRQALGNAARRPRPRSGRALP